MVTKKGFKIATFNANSLRARLHIIIPWLEEQRVDVLCIQETKVQDKDFPKEAFSNIGYQVVFKGQKSYNGVAVVSLHSIEEFRVGFEDGEDTPDDLTRLIRCRIMGIPIVNTYVPQGRAIDHPNYQIKLRWFKRLRRLFERDYSPDQNLIWCGDMNVAPEYEDVYSPEDKLDHVCFHQEVRQALRQVKNWGFVDLFRQFNKEPGQYTFYDYRIRGAVKKGLGWRIDQIYVTSPLAQKALNCWIDLKPRLMKKPSDHTFLIGEFDL